MALAPLSPSASFSPSRSIPAGRGLRLAALPGWWHLLSLDAPTVAALWSWSMARALSVPLPWTSPLLLALGTWLVYVADRILDGLALGSPQALKTADALHERHFFYARHRTAFLAASLPAGLLLLWLIVARMGAAARREDVAVFAAALLYFCVVHRCGARAERWLPKELAVGVLFAAATAVPAWSRRPAHGGLPVSGTALALLPVIFFAALCWLNCVAIEKWERARGAGAQALIPHRTTRWGQSRLQGLCGGVSLAAVGAGASGRLLHGSPAASALFLACALSAGALAALDYGQERLDVGAFPLRIAADAVMLTPLLFVLILR